jgi:hypothetical protein
LRHDLPVNPRESSRLHEVGSLNYERQLLALIAEAHDGHAAGVNPNFAQARPPGGKCFLPLQFAYIQNQVVVLNSLLAHRAMPPILRREDVITSLDGTSVQRLIRE